jgi:hypothetical protein
MAFVSIPPGNHEDSSPESPHTRSVPVTTPFVSPFLFFHPPLSL